MQFDLVLIPDIHLGIEGREWRYDLVTEIINLATTHQAEICFLGDTIDLVQVCTKEGARKRITQHHELTTALRTQVATVKPTGLHPSSIHWMRGNHDEVVNEQHWRDLWDIPVTAHEGFFVFKNHDILVHHGHLITYRKGPKPDLLLERLENSTNQYSASNKTERLAAFKNFFSEDVETAVALEQWNREATTVGTAILEIIFNCGKWLQRLPKSSGDDLSSAYAEKLANKTFAKIDNKTMQRLQALYVQLKTTTSDHMITSLLTKIKQTKNHLWKHLLRKETLIAEAAAKTLGVRATVSGHTHHPLLHRWAYTEKQNPKVYHTIIGNAGSIFSHAHRLGGIGPSYIAVDTKSIMHLFEWSPHYGWKIIASEALTKN